MELEPLQQELKPQYINKKKCVWCGGALTGRQTRYHPECRRQANKEREDKGTEAPKNPHVCAWTGCSKVVPKEKRKKGGRYCCDACKMKAYRARKKRENKKKGT